METSRRKQPSTENRRKREINKRDAGLHQRSRALLILQNRKTKVPGHGKVRGVSDTVREQADTSGM